MRSRGGSSLLRRCHVFFVFALFGLALTTNTFASPTTHTTPASGAASEETKSIAADKANAPIRVLVLDPTPSNVEKVTIEIVAGLIAVELSRLEGLSIMTASDVQKMFALEASKANLGCDAASCLTELANALGSDLVVFGNVGRLGGLFVITLHLFDTASANSTGRISVQTRNVEELPSLLAENLPTLFSNAVPRLATLALPAEKAQLQPEANNAGLRNSTDTSRPFVPPGGSEHPMTLTPEVLERVQVFEDGSGNYVVRDAQKESFAPFFAGRLERLYAQRIIGGGSEGNIQWNEVFWDPRHGSNWLSSLNYSAGTLQLRCGDKVVTYQLLAPQPARDAMAKARFFDVRWQRTLYAVLRNDDAEWWVIDRARKGRAGAAVRAEDFRLYRGRRGNFDTLDLQDVISDGAGDLFFAKEGKLVLASDKTARWETKDASMSLRWLDLGRAAGDTYGSLGLYQDPLGTPCDIHSD